MNVKQAANVLELLEFFAQHRRPATLAEIAKHFDWPRSSTFNLLGTLASHGFLYEPRARGGITHRRSGPSLCSRSTVRIPLRTSCMNSSKCW